MQWWQEFPGWLITTSLAFLAFAVVAWQEIRRRVLLPSAEWEGSLVQAPIANGRADQYFSLRNKGDIDARDVMVLAYNCVIPGKDPGTLFGVAEVMVPKRVALESVNDDSYLVVSWRSPNHHARKLITWLPVREGTAVALHHWDQRMWPWYRVAWAQMRRPHHAGPGTALHAWLPTSPRRMIRMTKKLKGKVSSDHRE